LPTEREKKKNEREKSERREENERRTRETERVFILKEKKIKNFHIRL
jgi:hypothetical protein